MKNNYKIVRSALIVGSVIFFIERSLTPNGFNQSTTTLLIVFIIMQLYSFTISIANYSFFSFLDNFITWKEKPLKRLIYGSIGSIIITLICIVFLRLVVVYGFEKGTFQDFLNTSKNYYIFSIIISVNVLIVIHAIYFFKAFTAKKIKEHKVVSEIQSAKFESLKNQLDPHFLFNSLNVLTSLIEENPKLAEKFTTKLSKIYRYVLQRKNEDLIPLQKELSFAKDYMDLLKIRFEESISYQIPTEISNPNYKIVPLSLQLLLENTIKHNQVSEKDKLFVKIYEENEYLIIENNKTPKATLEKSTKVGLQNIINRYKILTDKPVIIEDKKQLFTVKLPLLAQKDHIMNTNYYKEQRYFEAKEKVKRIKEFYYNLLSYLVIIPFLFFIWYKYTPNVIQWFWLPAFGWGIGLFFQAVKTFDIFPVFSKDWERKKIKSILQEEDINDIKF